MSLSLGKNVSFAEVAGLLGAYRELGFDRWFLRVRTVAVKVQGQGWINFATAALLLESNSEGVKHLTLRDEVALIESCHEVREGLSPDALADRLTRWQSVVGSINAPRFQSSVYLSRTYSEPATYRWPEWSTQPYEQSGESKSFNVPDGPFLSVNQQVFGKDVPRRRPKANSYRRLPCEAAAICMYGGRAVLW